MKKYQDMTSLERLNYMRKPYLDMTSKNISRQVEEEARMKKLVKGTIAEDEIDYSDDINVINDRLLSLISYIRQMPDFFSNRSGGYTGITIKSGVYTSALSLVNKIMFNYDILISKLQDILNDIMKDPTGEINLDIFDDTVDIFKKFRDVIKDFNDFFNPRKQGKNFISKINIKDMTDLSINQNNSMQKYLYDIRSKAIKVRSIMKKLNEIAKFKGDVAKIGQGVILGRLQEMSKRRGSSSKIGQGTIPKKYL